MTRTIIFASIVYCAALATWAIARLSSADVTQNTGTDLFAAIVVTQGIALFVFTPWLMQADDNKTAAGFIALIVTAWPLLLLATEIAGLSPTPALFSQLWLLALMAASAAISFLISKFLTRDQTKSVAITALQTVPACILWLSAETWLSWFIG